MGLRIQRGEMMDLVAQEDKARERHVAEMERLEMAIKKTKSKCLKNDYMKKLTEMRLDLIDYDKFRRECCK